MVQLLSWELRLLGVLVGTLAAATVIHWASSSSRWTASPALRLATAAPLVIAFALAPLLFDRAEPVTTVFTAFLLTWLGIFKMLAWAAGRGPLSQQPWSLAQLWALLLLPILPQPAAGGARPRSRADADTSPGTTLQLSLRWLAKLGVTAAVVFALADAGDGAAADAAAGSAVTAGALYRTCLYAVGLYSMLGVAMDGPAALLLRPLGLRLAPHFRSPWLSSSVAEFWNWRWNQAASGVLRHLVYEPIVEGRLVALPRRAAGRSRGGSGGVSSSGAGGGRGGKGADGKAAPGLRQLAGMSAAFVASGVAHEIIFWYISGRFSPCLSWLMYFSVQAPLVAGERALLLLLRQAGVVPPQWARTVVTLCILLCTAHWLFMLPAERAGLPGLLAGSMRQTFGAAAAAVLPRQS